MIDRGQEHRVRLFQTLWSSVVAVLYIFVGGGLIFVFIF